MLDFIETEKIRRAKNIIDSFTRPEPHADETYSISRALAALYGRHMPGFPIQNIPRWDDSLEKVEHVKLKRRYEAFGLEFMEGDLLVPDWAWQRSSHGRRVMDAGSGPKGGYAVGSDTPFHDSLLRAASVAFQCGVQLVQAGQNSFGWPKQISASTPAWLIPGGSATSSAGTYVQISSTPKTLLTFVECSLQLLMQASQASEQFITDGLQRDLASAVDLAVLQGTGAQGQPLGILNTPGVQTQSGTTLNAGCATMKQKAAEANSRDAGISFLSTPAVRALLEGREKATGGGNFVWQNDRVADRPAYVSTNMPTGVMLCGDLSLVSLIEWGVLVLRINPYQNFNAGLVGIRALWMVDVAVRYPTAFIAATSVT
jgi:HK97 family phage major capsid protein